MNVASNLDSCFPQNTKLTRKDKAKIAAGSIGAVAAGNTVASASGLIGFALPFVNEKFLKTNPQQNQLLREAVEKTLELSGVKNKGVVVDWATSSGRNLSAIEKIKLMINPAKSKEMIQEGLNACFDPKKNKVLVSGDKIPFVAFHEVGHSINCHNSRFGKALQKMRMPALALVTLPMLYGAFTKESKPKDGQELTKKQKANNFIRNNAGKLSFAMMLPVLAEEGMASIRGYKFANKLLPKNLSKIVAKANAIGYLSYLGIAVGAALGSYAAVKIKDAVVNKTEAKAAAKNA